MSTRPRQGSKVLVPLPRLLFQLALRMVVVCGFGINLMQVPSEDKSRVACTVALLRKYFNSGDSLSGSVLCVSVTPHVRDVLDQLLHGIDQDQSYPWTIQATRHQLKDEFESRLQILHEKPRCYFLVVENLDDVDLEEIFEYWKLMLNWNPLAQFVVYLASVEETDEEMTDLMVEMMLTFMNSKLYNVNVIGQSDENNLYYAKTVFPYHPDNNCGNRVIAVEVLDSCSYEAGDEVEDSDEEEDVSMENEDEGENGETEIEEAEIEDAEVEEHTNNLTDIVINTPPVGDSFRSFKEDSNDTEPGAKQPDVTIQEYVRARFEDKFPHDLSGCPIRAAYRGPWEPYIFSSSMPLEPEDLEQVDEGNATDTEQSYDEGYEAVEDYTGENTNSNQNEETPTKTKLTGIEYQLIQTIAEQLHVDIEFKTQSSNVFHLFQQLIEG